MTRMLQGILQCLTFHKSQIRTRTVDCCHFLFFATSLNTSVALSGCQSVLEQVLEFRRQNKGGRREGAISTLPPTQTIIRIEATGELLLCEVNFITTFPKETSPCLSLIPSFPPTPRKDTYPSKSMLCTNPQEHSLWHQPALEDTAPGLRLSGLESGHSCPSAVTQAEKV